MFEGKACGHRLTSNAIVRSKGFRMSSTGIKSSCTVKEVGMQGEVMEKNAFRWG